MGDLDFELPPEDMGGEASGAVSDFVEAELGLDVLARFGAKGRKQHARPALEFDVVRELVPEDALAWEKAPARQVGEVGGTPSLQRIRTIHHQVARMLVAGDKIVHISAALGITPERIQQLKNDPTFVELCEHYAEVEEAAEVSLKHRFLLLGTAGMEELQDRLLNEPDSFGNGHLMDLVKLTIGGEAPRAAAPANGTRTLTPDDMAALKAAADSRGRTQISYKKEETADGQGESD